MTEPDTEEEWRLPPPDEATPPLPRSRRLERLGIGLSAIVALLLASVVGLVLYLNHRADYTNHLRAQRDAQIGALSQQVAGGQNLAKQIRTTCKTKPRTLPAAVCAKASSVAAQPTVTAGEPGAQGAAGPGPTDAQIAAGIGAYFTAHPSLTQINYTRLRGFVDDYLTAHPASSGKAGSSGAPGQDATDAQIAPLLASYLAAHPAPSGPAGQNGANGTGVPGQNGQDGKDGTDGKDGASGQPGYPPGQITIEVPNVLGGSTTEYCTPDGAAGPGDQPNYSCSTTPPASATTPTPGAS